MGQKVHPEALRVGYIHDWKANWYNERHFADYLDEDEKIRGHIIGKLAHAGLSDITIRKDANEVEVNIHTARPGIVIGKSGSEVDALRKDLHRMTGKAIKVNILEIKRPELDAKLVAQSIAEQLQNRVAFRRAMKRALTSAMRSGAKGVRCRSPAAWAAPRWRAPRATRTGASRCTRCVRTSTTASTRRARPSAASASSAGSTRARSCPRATPAPTSPSSSRRRPARRRRPRRDGRGRGRGDGRGRGVAARAAVAPAARVAVVAVPVVVAARAARVAVAARAAVVPAARVAVVAVAVVAARVVAAAAAAASWSGWRRWPRSRRWRRRSRSGWRRRRRSLMLQPKRVKHRKQHRGRRAGLSRGQTTVQFGEYGIKALEAGWLTNRQIEAARIAMTRKIKRGGKVWINVFPDKPFTKKPAETRMGSGKGNPEGWVAVVKPGRVMFELAGVDEGLAREAMRLAGHKLPVKTKFVQREEAGS